VIQVDSYTRYTKRRRKKRVWGDKEERKKKEESWGDKEERKEIV